MGRKPKKINISMIAKEAGVSESTVSRALNHRANVGEATRKKINELMMKYDFTLGSPSPREKKIALLSGSVHFSEYIAGIFTGIYEYTMQNSLVTTIIFKQDNSKQSLLEQIRDQQCAGVIVLSPTEFSDSISELADSELPVMLIDETKQMSGLGFIDNDSYSGSREAAQYLLQLGHRSIGYIECGLKTLNHIQRVKAYENVLKEAGIEMDQRWIIQTENNSNLYQKSFTAMQKLLKRAPELTAVMTSNDVIAIGAMKGAMNMGRSIPEDLSIIGFDNYYQTEFISPALTTINHPTEQAGFLAAQSIDQYFKQLGNGSLVQDILPTKLIVRESTAPRMKLQELSVSTR